VNIEFCPGVVREIRKSLFIMCTHTKKHL